MADGHGAGPGPRFRPESLLPGCERSPACSGTGSPEESPCCASARRSGRSRRARTRTATPRSRGSMRRSPRRPVTPSCGAVAPCSSDVAELRAGARGSHAGRRSRPRSRARAARSRPDLARRAALRRTPRHRSAPRASRRRTICRSCSRTHARSPVSSAGARPADTYARLVCARARARARTSSSSGSRAIEAAGGPGSPTHCACTDAAHRGARSSARARRAGPRSRAARGPRRCRARASRSDGSAGPPRATSCCSARGDPRASRPQRSTRGPPTRTRSRRSTPDPGAAGDAGGETLESRARDGHRAPRAGTLRERPEARLPVRRARSRRRVALGALAAPAAFAEILGDFLVPAGASWRYLDDGSDPGHRLARDRLRRRRLGAGARPARLRRRRRGHRRELRSERAHLHAGNFITTYFRKTFTVSDAGSIAAARARAPARRRRGRLPERHRGGAQQHARGRDRVHDAGIDRGGRLGRDRFLHLRDRSRPVLVPAPTCSRSRSTRAARPAATSASTPRCR